MKMVIDFNDCFLRAGRATAKDDGLRTQEKRDFSDRQRGLKIFKRRVLGFCGKESYKSVDELAKILVDIHAVPNIDGGRALVPRFYGSYANYGSKELCFGRAGTRDGAEGCRVWMHTPQYYSGTDESFP